MTDIKIDIKDDIKDNVKEDVKAKQVENVKDEALQTIRSDLRSLQLQRRSHRNRLIKFQRSQKYFDKHLPEDVKEESDEKKKSVVKLTYQLLRTFCYTYNFITITDREVGKFCIPEDFKAELKEVMTAEFFSKFAAAINSPKEEYEKELPDHVNEQVVEKLLKFVSVKQTIHITDKYEAHLKVLTEQIETKTKERDAIQPPKEKKIPQKRQRSSRKNSDSDADDSADLEDRLHQILTEVSKRSDSVRFSKDDFEAFSEAQAQLDSLMRETVTEIFRMKQSLRKRFAQAQSRKRTSKNKRRY